MKIKTNFGAINGQRIITFARPLANDRVLPKRYAFEQRNEIPVPRKLWISPHEAFRRWKIARKAWRARKRKQPELPL